MTKDEIQAEVERIRLHERQQMVDQFYRYVYRHYHMKT